MRFADFFAGIGLASIGLERAGWRCVFANDIDERKKQLHNVNLPGGHYVRDDIANIRGTDLPSVALAWASFPCTDLSLAGERQGLTGHDSGTLWEFLRVIDEMRREGRAPQLVVLENVAGFLTSRKGRDFHAAISALNAAGYVCDVLVIDAVHFVPQSRPRLFVVASRTNGEVMRPLRRSEWPPVSTLRPRAVANYMAANPDLSWALLTTLPEPPVRTLKLRDILEDLPPDSHAWWSKERVTYLLSQMSPKHLGLVREAKRREHLTIMTVYRRVRQTGSMAEVRADGIAGCLRTPRGGSSRQIVLFVGQGSLRVRFMTGREYARLQGVPDTYRITVPEGQALFGFGDAVCVPVVEWLARHGLTPLATEAVGLDRALATVG